MTSSNRHCRHTAVYPGTFDPFTLGHEDLVRRAALIFDRLIVAVVVHSRKQTMFTLEERMQMMQDTLHDLPNVVVRPFDGLLVDYVHSLNAHVIVRGLRAFSDFEYEFQMALTNRALAPDIETLFLMPQEQYSYISSSTVREVMEAGAELVRFVPQPVLNFIQARRRAAQDGGRRTEDGSQRAEDGSQRSVGPLAQRPPDGSENEKGFRVRGSGRIFPEP